MTKPIAGFDLGDAEELGNKIVEVLFLRGMLDGPDDYAKVGLAMLLHGLPVQGAQLAGVLADHGDAALRSAEFSVHMIIKRIIQESFQVHYEQLCQEKAAQAIQQAAAKET